MADIKYNLTPTAPTGYRDFTPQDINLSTEVLLPAEFNRSQHIIQLHIYNPTGERLFSVADYRNAKELSDSASAGKTGTDALYIDPIEDSKAYGFTTGNVNLNYLFLKPLLPVGLAIKELSSDRTELKVTPTGTVDNLQQVVQDLKTRFTSDVYFDELRLDFGNNVQLIGINIDQDNTGNILIKLYEPLPSTIQLKTVFRLLEEVANPVAYYVTATVTPTVPTANFLKGPNFNIEVDGSPSISTEYLDYNELYSYPVTSSYHQALTLLSGSDVRINVDYTDYTNFVHFSSAYERLVNFKYKLDLVTNYEDQKAATGSLSNTQTAVTQSNLKYDNLITGIISKFDGYEKYLYFESSSKSWPKSSSTRPYLNLPSTDAAATAWFVAQAESASLYDELNESRLVSSIPEFIRQDSENAPYSLFLDMIGQHFDNLWIYAKGVTDKYDADNRLDYGVSRDFIEATLKSFGVKLYSSNFSTGNLASMLIGEWYDSGSEYISTFVTASNEPTPDSNILHETYKRLYHNLPYLLKTKGTERGLRALINSFGIPSGSLEVKAYGGVERPGVTPYFASGLPEGDKLRLSNTGSIVPGETLSQYVSIQKDDNKFTQDLHTVEVGFSPSYNVDNFISGGITGSFNIDQYIGDPRYLYSKNYSNDTNGNLYKVAETLLSGSNSYDVFDFIRLIKFFDNQLFKMVGDFLPARDVVTSGVIIKPHVLNRSKIQSAQTSYTRPEYTASIDTLFVTGSDGGVINEYSTAHTASIQTLVGELTQIRNTEVEKINGELGGSTLDLYSGSLNEANVFKQFNAQEITYDYIEYLEGDSPTVTEDDFLTQLPVSIGKMYTFRAYQPKGGYHYLKYILFRNVSANGVNVKEAVRVLEEIYVNGVKYSFAEKNVTESTTLLTLADPGGGFFANPAAFPTSQVTVPVILSPFFTARFDNSDYNALFNNASLVANTGIVQKVDYSDNPLVPINLAGLLTNTAEKSDMQEYVHNSAGYVRGRYKGHQLNAVAINKYTVGDISYGTTPVLESTTPYFCIFDFISGFSPEHNKANAIVIGYIVDEEGNLTTPDATVALNLLKQGFPANSEFEVSIKNANIGGSEATLLGNHSVLRSGTRLEPLLFSYTAPTYLNPVFSTGNKLEFRADPTLATYNARATGSNQSITNLNIEDVTKVTFGKELQDDAGYYNPGTSIYTFGSDTEQQVKFTAVFTVSGDGWPNPYGGDPGLAEVRLEVATDGGTFDPAFTTTLASKQFTYINYIPTPVALTAPFRNFNSGEAVRTVVEILDRTADLTFISSILTVGSYESGSTYIGTGSDGYFFSTGSLSSPTVLTGSTDLSSKYGNYFEGVSGSASQGFNGVNLQFTLQRGDEIKFNNSETQAYMVTDVLTPSETTTGRLYVTLDKTMSTAVNKDFFALRRYVDSSNMILMNIDRVAGTQNTGILYLSIHHHVLKQTTKKLYLI